MPVTARDQRALATLDRWRAQHAVHHADPLDEMAACMDWVRAEIKLIRKLRGQESREFTGQLADRMRAWALQIDQQIRDLLGEPS